MRTTCRNCVFAVYDGDTQTDCYIGRIDAFEKQGVGVVGEDDGQLKYIIIDRFCNACRAAESIKDGNLLIEHLKSTIRKEVEIRVAAIIYANGDSTKESLETSLRSLVDQVIQPVHLIVLLDGSSIVPPIVISLLKKVGLPFPWEVVEVHEPDKKALAPYEGRLFDHAVDIGVAKVPKGATYYTVASAGFVWPLDYIQRIDIAINDHMVSLSAVLPPTDENRFNGYCVQVKLHNHCSVIGNIGLNIIDKLPVLQRDCGNSWAVLPYDELAMI